MLHELFSFMFLPQEKKNPAVEHTNTLITSCQSFLTTHHWWLFRERFLSGGKSSNSCGSPIKHRKTLKEQVSGDKSPLHLPKEVYYL